MTSISDTLIVKFQTVHETDENKRRKHVSEQNAKNSCCQISNSNMYREETLSHRPDIQNRSKTTQKDTYSIDNVHEMIVRQAYFIQKGILVQFMHIYDVNNQLHDSIISAAV